MKNEKCRHPLFFGPEMRIDLAPVIFPKVDIIPENLSKMKCFLPAKIGQFRKQKLG